MCPNETNTTSGITLTWPVTPAGEISTLPCPKTDGNATRNCTDGGVWEEPNVDNCKCPDDPTTTSGISLMWSSTPVGETAVLFCPNTNENATRNCTDGGVWEEPNVDDCTCPDDPTTTSGISLMWSSTPVGETAVLTCPNTDGNATRRCTDGGVWEEPNVDNCTCPDDPTTTSGISLMWSSTPVGETAFLSCPNTDGNATRNCTVGGVWEEPNVDDCTCPDDPTTTSGISLMWSSTPVGETAVLSCPNTDGNATRNCTVGGVWEEPNVDDCTCPDDPTTTSGISLMWSSTPVGETAVLSCPNTDGNATRNCTVGGVWEEPNVGDCTCPDDPTTTAGISLMWSSTPVGETAVLTCPNTDGNATRNCTVGGVWEEPYVDDCTCPDDPTTTSGISLMWSSTPVGETAVLSCPNTDGNATRNCTVGGVWEEPNVDDCTCPDDPTTTSGISLMWSSTPVGETAVLSCPNTDGNATRNCTVGGVWEELNIGDCTCPDDPTTTAGISLMWSSTPVGETAVLTCPNTDGNATRNCTVGGVWEEPNVDDCTCPDDPTTTSGISLMWSSTPVGETAVLSCPNTNGNATRNCTVGGVWEEPNVDDCTCPDDPTTTSGISLMWSSTPVGETAVLSCPNTNGNATRNCTVGGVWEEPNIGDCICPGDPTTTAGISLMWSSTPVGETAVLTCPNTDGNATRNCTVGGVWEEPNVDDCTCPDDPTTTSGISLMWSSTPIGETAFLSCPNTDGNATRRCTVGGVWEEPNVDNCTCPDDPTTTSGISLMWSSTPVGVTAVLSCPNTDGNATRNCTGGGVWEEPNVDDCTCPDDPTTTSGISLMWSSTPVGETAVLSCPNTDGNATRNCTGGGVWEEPNVDDCTCPDDPTTTSGISLMWSSTPVGETAVLSCPNTDGNATRNCTVGGVWEEPNVDDCTCPDDPTTTLGISLMWSSTPVGVTAVLSCPNTDGNATRNCTVGGVWEEPNVDNCTCPDDPTTTSGISLMWSSTPVGETAVLSCPNTDGNATRNCTVGGVWEQPYVRNCFTCPLEINTTSGITLTWPLTPIGQTSILSCPNTNGSATRSCTVEGVWEQPFVCDCLTQRISQQLCNVCDSIHFLCTVVVLMLLVSSLPCV